MSNPNRGNRFFRPNLGQGGHRQRARMNRNKTTRQTKSETDFINKQQAELREINSPKPGVQRMLNETCRSLQNLNNLDESSLNDSPSEILMKVCFDD